MIRPLLWLPLTAVLLAPVLAQETSLEKRALKLHALAGGDWCEPWGDGIGYSGEDRFASWTITYQPSWNPDAEEETVTLIRIFCFAGAYNMVHAYYWHREYDGLQPLAFAQPAYRTEYENDDVLEGRLLGVTVTGMGATTTLVNSEFDPETQTITSHSLWRGIGDASSSGTWQFRDGEFALEHFEIDASYDGEGNPETVLDYRNQ